MNFNVNGYYWVSRYCSDGYHDRELMNGFQCKIIAKHCEYDEASGLWVNHHIDCAYDIEEWHK